MKKSNFILRIIKKVREKGTMCVLALLGIGGAGSAFTISHHQAVSNASSRAYGVTGKFTDGAGNHYSIALEQPGDFCNPSPNTCEVSVPDNGVTLSTVLTTGINQVLSNGDFQQI